MSPRNTGILTSPAPVASQVQPVTFFVLRGSPVLGRRDSGPSCKHPRSKAIALMSPARGREGLIRPSLGSPSAHSPVRSVGRKIEVTAAHRCIAYLRVPLAGTGHRFCRSREITSPASTKSCHRESSYCKQSNVTGLPPKYRVEAERVRDRMGWTMWLACTVERFEPKASGANLFISYL